jgi:hypothetical protein
VTPTKTPVRPRTITYRVRVNLTDVLTPRCRVLDLGVTDVRMLQDLHERGVEPYLGLADPAVLPPLRRELPEHQARFAPLEGRHQAFRCSTDLLILRGEHFAALWQVRALKHVRFIAVERSAQRRAEQRVVRRYALRTGVVVSRGTTTLGGITVELLEVMRKAKPVTRRYLSPVVGVAGLGKELERAGVSYAILRWYEHLPELEPGEDLDLLVADDDLTRLHALVEQEPGTIPMDVYSESGLPGSDFRNMAYYPPELARQLIHSAVNHPSGLRVLGPREHLLALAYHAAYHKGPRSGLPSATTEPVADPEHDYVAALRGLGEENGVELTLTLDGLDTFLRERGWAPSVDTRHRLAAWNPWLAAQMPRIDAPHGHRRPEPAVFFVRERLEELLTEDEIADRLAHAGFEVLATRRLDAESQARTASHTRGGNWARGPFPESGGLPVLAVAALHYSPKPPRTGVRDRYPRLTNGDCLEVKEDFRALVAERMSPQEQFNPIHSSDNEEEAWEYVALSMPDRVEELRGTVERRRAEFTPSLPVVRELSRGRRARVDVVLGESGPRVRKTYARGFPGHLSREVGARRTLEPLSAFVPPLLERGELWFDCPYYDDGLRRRLRAGQLLPLRVVRQMVDVLRQVDALGYDLVDAKPDNFLWDAHEGLKVVDLEFLYPKDDRSRTFPDSYVPGRPPVRDMDLPAPVAAPDGASPRAIDGRIGGSPAPLPHWPPRQGSCRGWTTRGPTVCGASRSARAGGGFPCRPAHEGLDGGSRGQGMT